MSCKPAEIFRLKGGKLIVGAPADVTILDLEQEWIVDNTKFYTTGKVSPFNGKNAKAKLSLLYWPVNWSCGTASCSKDKALCSKDKTLYLKDRAS